MHMPMSESFACWTSCWLTRAVLLATFILHALCQFVPGQAVTGALVLSLYSSVTQGHAYSHCLSAGFGVETLDGTFEIQTKIGPNRLPLLLTAYDETDASSRLLFPLLPFCKHHMSALAYHLHQLLMPPPGSSGTILHLYRIL